MKDDTRKWSDPFAFARARLGDDFITPQVLRSALRAYRIEYSLEQIDQLMNKLPSEETLLAVRAKNGVLLPEPPRSLSLLGLHEVCKKRPEQFCTRAGGWPDTRPAFATQECSGTGGWLALGRFAHSNPSRRPSVVIGAWFLMVYANVYGIRLFESDLVATSTRDQDGCVCIGGYDNAGIRVCVLPEGEPLLGMCAIPL
jgi:hypothetical protein